MPGAGVCLQVAQKAAPTASSFCHPHHPTAVPCSSDGDDLLSEPSPLSDECLCPPALSCVGDGSHGCCEETKPSLWQHHKHWVELAVPPQQPSLSPVPLCPLWEHASCAMSWGLCVATHVPTVGYKGCRSGVEHPTSCSGTVLGSCCRRESRNDIPEPERPFSLGRVSEMGSHGNRLQHSLTCKRPQRQLWGEDPGTTTSPLGGRDRPTPTLPGCLPRSAQTPGGQGLLHFFSFAAQNRKSQNIGLSLG